MTTTASGEEATADTIDGLRLGGGTFTRLPMTPPRVVDAAAGRVAMLSAPIWGLLLGGLAGALAGAAWWWLGRDGAPPDAAAGLCAVIGLTALAWLSRGLHLDGLADTIDGFASMRRGADAFSVMRDPQVGALGAAGLVLILLTQISALAVVVTATSPAGIAAVMAAMGLISRGVLPWAVRAGTPAADSGLGNAVVGSVPSAQAAVALTVTAAASAGLLIWTGLPVVAALLPCVAAAVASILLRRSAIVRFGAVNGDVLGALVEVAAAGALVVTALAVG